MHDYQFSTIKVVPQSARKEPVAVGVILYDPKRGEIYRKFTDNWDEVRRRTGLATLPDIRSITKEGPIKVAGGGRYLADLAENQFPDALLVTRPNNLMPFDTPLDALEWTFGTHIGLPARADAGGDARVRRPMRCSGSGSGLRDSPPARTSAGTCSGRRLRASSSRTYS